VTLDGRLLVDAHVHVARLRTLSEDWQAWSRTFGAQTPLHALFDADGVPVPEDHRPEPEQEVHVLVAVDVPDPRAGPAGHERRVGHPAELGGPGAAARSARDDDASLVEQLARAARPRRVPVVERHVCVLQ